MKQPIRNRGPLVAKALCLTSHLLLATGLSLAAVPVCSAARYGADATPYPLYAMEFGVKKPLDREDVAFLTENFEAYFGSIEVSREMADYARELRPGFEFLHYIGNWRVNREALQRVENGERDSILYYRVGDLKRDLSPRETLLKINHVFGTLPEVKESSPRVWLRIGDEWMRIREINQAGITVERGWSGSEAAAHLKGAPVLAPAQGRNREAVDKPFQFRHDGGARLRWEQILDFMLERYRDNGSGVWIDILIGNFGIYTLGGEPLGIQSGREWDLRRNEPYTEENLSRYTEEAVTWMQQAFKDQTGVWPVIWANNMQFPLSREDPRLQLLLPSVRQPRPLDGFAMENMYAHWGYGGGSGKEFMWVPADEWEEHLQSLMLMGELKVNARPLMFDGGIDNLKFARLPHEERQRLIDYGYASYLLGVKVEEDGSICTIVGSTPMVVEAGPDGMGEQVRFHLYDCFTWDIGRPAENRPSDQYARYRLPGTPVFMRRFENGIVLVNPTGEAVSDIVLPEAVGNLMDPRTGRPVAKSISMGPRTGRILLREGAVHR